MTDDDSFVNEGRARRLRKQTSKVDYADLSGEEMDTDPFEDNVAGSSRGGRRPGAFGIPASYAIPVPTGTEPYSVEKILNHKLVDIRPPELDEEGNPIQRNPFPGCPKGKDLEFFVKWKGRSYLHAGWFDYFTILGLDYSPPTNERAVKRYEQSQLKSVGHDWRLLDESEQPELDPNYMEVSRIISCNTTLVPEHQQAITRELRKVVMDEVRTLTCDSCVSSYG